MTRERLIEILDMYSINVIILEGNPVLLAMTQAVNEALDEAAEKATAYNTVPRYYTDAIVNRDSILNLKINYR